MERILFLPPRAPRATAPGTGSPAGVRWSPDQRRSRPVAPTCHCRSPRSSPAPRGRTPRGPARPPCPTCPSTGRGL